MTLHRRNLLKGGIALSAMTLSATTLLPSMADAQDGQITFNPVPGAWRTFDVVTRVEPQPDGPMQAWIPVPSVNEAEWFKSMPSKWKTNARSSELERDSRYGAEFLHVSWDASEKAPFAEVTSRVATRDRAIDLSSPRGAPALSAQERALNLAPTAMIPTDEIVRDTAIKITAGAVSDVEKARAIYEWIVENTFRDAKVRGCGVGDVAAMLKTGNLGGKCADLNALFVGLARASGVPARDVYGVRIAPSRFGYRSLGARSEIISKAQHCRAEVYLSGFGWVPADPADVRKVVLEEPPGHLAMNEPRVVAARKTLFGAWEGNWLAYNFGHDIVLPGASGPRLEFLMYPQAETAAGRLDCLEPDTFKYAITSRETNAA